MGFGMITKGRMAILPKKIKHMESINTILEPLDVQFEEIDDWNCCGATDYLGINLIPAYSLLARNLALASKQMNLDGRAGGIG